MPEAACDACGELTLSCEAIKKKIIYQVDDETRVNVSLFVDADYCVYFYAFDPEDVEPVFIGGGEGVGLDYAYARWNEMGEFGRVEGRRGVRDVPEASGMCNLSCVRCDISGAKQLSAKWSAGSGAGCLIRTSH